MSGGNETRESPPILFIVFNRPDTTIEVLKAIAAQRPASLYVAADGARPNRPEEATRVAAVRQAVLDAIDWPCEVKTNFQERNLGCRGGVIAAIDWFFENEAEGIILEDDVIPSPDFFRFCTEMLERFRDEPRIMLVSGTNPLEPGSFSSSYFFSSLGSIWGWASWRRAWAQYDVEMTGWETGGLAAELHRRHGAQTARYLRRTFDFHRKNNVDTWDTQWAYTVHANNGLAVVPGTNLIRNIGIVGAHSSVETSNHNLAHGKIQWPISPRNLALDDDADFRRNLTKKILTPAMILADLSYSSRRLGIHRPMKAAYGALRAVRNFLGV